MTGLRRRGEQVECSLFEFIESTARHRHQPSARARRRWRHPVCVTSRDAAGQFVSSRSSWADVCFQPLEPGACA
jgi:hypothetical protein